MPNVVTIEIDGDNIKAISAINQVETKLTGMDNKAKTAANNSSNSFGMLDQALSKVGVNLGSLTAGFAAGTIVAGLGAMVKSAIDTADAMADMSRKTGISVESLSTLDYAASQNGTSLESLVAATKKLSSAMLGLSEDGDKPNNALSKIGVQAVDSTGKMRNVEAVLMDVADKFQQMPDGAQKAATAVSLFGKSGMELIPLLNNGAEGIQNFKEEAKKLGLEISTNTAIMADNFNDKLDVISRQAKSVGMTMASELLPALIEVGAGFSTFLAQGNNAKIIGEGLSVVIKVLATLFIQLGGTVVTTAQALGTYWAMMAKIVTLNWDEIGTAFNIGMGQVQKTIDATWESSVALWSTNGAQKLAEDVRILSNETARLISPSGMLGLSATTADVITGFNKLVPGVTLLNSSLGKSKKTFEELYLEIQGKINKAALPEMAYKIQQGVKEIDNLVKVASNMDERVKAALGYYSYVYYLSDIQEEAKKTVKSLQDISMGDYSNPVTKVMNAANPVENMRVPMESWRDINLMTYEEMANGAVASFDMMSQAALAYYQLGGERSRAMLNLYKATAIANTAITTYQAATSALMPPPVGLGPIWGIPLMASTIALGIANIAKISSTQLGGGVSGSSGSSGLTSIPTTTTRTTNNTNNTRTQNVTIVINGSVVNHDELARELVPALQKAYGDGV